MKSICYLLTAVALLSAQVVVAQQTSGTPSASKEHKGRIVSASALNTGKALNPQPLPPAKAFAAHKGGIPGKALNPQPLPPAKAFAAHKGGIPGKALNPQPLPPAKAFATPVPGGTGRVQKPGKVLNPQPLPPAKAQ